MTKKNEKQILKEYFMKGTDLIFGDTSVVELENILSAKPIVKKLMKESGYDHHFAPIDFNIADNDIVQIKYALKIDSAHHPHAYGKAIFENSLNLDLNKAKDAKILKALMDFRESRFNYSIQGRLHVVVDIFQIIKKYNSEGKKPKEIYNLLRKDFPLSELNKALSELSNN